MQPKGEPTPFRVWRMSGKIIFDDFLPEHLHEKSLVELSSAEFEKSKKNFEDPKSSADFEDPNKRNLVSEVSILKPVLYPSSYKNNKTTIALVDCGAKNNILRSLLSRNVSVYRVPWDYDLFSESNSRNFDGIVLSNGPGDPKSCEETIEIAKKAIESKIPVFGICLGNQILALASGADTYKLKYGHRGQNQPAVLADSKRCFITSQNHEYAVNEKTLGKDWKPWFRNLNDGTNEGIVHKSGLFRSVQFHPESNPGPNDTAFLLDEFLDLVKKQKVGK